MTTLRRALRALRVQGEIVGTSNHALITDVTNRVNSNAKLTLPAKPLAGVPDLDQTLAIRAFDALRWLSESSALTYPVGLAGLQRNWPVLRYLGMFAPNPRHRLSPLGAQVIENHRRVLSEDLGIGFGLSVADVWCRAAVPGAVVTAFDVDVVLGRGYVQAGRQQRPVRRNRRRRPDYVLQIQDPANPLALQFRVVECKGTATATNTRSQLASAVGQLDSVTINGVVPPGLAVATYTGPGGWRFEAVDPDDGKVEAEVSDRVVTLVRDPKKWRAVVDGAKVEIDDPDRFAAESLRTSLATLAAFGGDEQVRMRYAQSERAEVRKLDERVMRSTPLGDARVVADVFSLGDQRFSIYQGLEATVDRALGADDPRDVLVAQGALGASSRPTSSKPVKEAVPAPTDVVRETPNAGEEGVWSLAANGMILGIVELS